MSSCSTRRARCATTRSDYDGFILFERVAYGRFTLRIAADSARTAGIMTSIDKQIEIDADRALARLGAIRLSKLARVAAVDPPR